MATPTLDRSADAANTVSSHVVGVMVEAALRAGADKEQLARLLGQDPALLSDDALRISTLKVSRLWELLDAFRAALYATLPDSGGDGVRLEKVARALRLGERTLQRRLAEHGTGWRTELETLRRDTALALLRDPAVPVRVVALRLGYRDHRVLARAFRRWTGQSPAGFRRSLVR
ncbi:helix-turn-helix transcriptional regulator [Nocardia sp. NPDC059764]|uniref:helix-turn-helix transcriptional regulator n=1 Tax=Nocardia sp. NPDC059764 TaxID=3346939 RepID=UPI00365780F1